MDRLEFIYYDFRATYMLFSEQRSTERLLADIHPLDTVQDAENLITRLNAVDAKFEQLVEHLNRQRNAGIVEPALSMNVAISQVSYFTNFRDKVGLIDGIGDAERDDLIARARSAVAGSVTRGYQRLRSELQNLVNNVPPIIGVGQFPRGADYDSMA